MTEEDLVAIEKTYPVACHACGDTVQTCDGYYYDHGACSASGKPVPDGAERRAPDHVDDLIAEVRRLHETEKKIAIALETSKVLIDGRSLAEGTETLARMYDLSEAAAREAEAEALDLRGSVDTLQKSFASTVSRRTEEIAAGRDRALAELRDLHALSARSEAIETIASIAAACASERGHRQARLFAEGRPGEAFIEGIKGGEASRIEKLARRVSTSDAGAGAKELRRELDDATKLLAEIWALVAEGPVPPASDRKTYLALVMECADMASERGEVVETLRSTRDELRGKQRELDELRHEVTAFIAAKDEINASIRSIHDAATGDDATSPRERFATARSALTPAVERSNKSIEKLRQMTRRRS